jgi:hypothetical protein
MYITELSSLFNNRLNPLKVNDESIGSKKKDNYERQNQLIGCNSSSHRSQDLSAPSHIIIYLFQLKVE